MKIILTSIFAVCLGLLGCKTIDSTNASTTVADAGVSTAAIAQDGILVGKIKRKDLESEQFGLWFNPKYEEYTVDSTRIDAIKKGLKGVDITLFMGTWCGDSKRETPRVYKILDAADYDSKKVDLIAVTRAKDTPEHYEEGLNITNVPTIIFKKDGKELGRIVEYPIESLEKDMLKILNGEEYKHAYAK
tara:strand:+ start:168 stop:734 length:567 start_codon:yes stop_codon:yes gene_type:complete